MKRMLIMALAVGAVMSTILLAIERPTDFAFLSLEWPGVSAAYLAWGALGVSAVMGVGISWAVNALVYATAAFAILGTIKLMRLALAK